MTTIKERKHDLSKILPPVKLFLEDLRRLESIYRDNCESYQIVTDKYELSSFKELEDLENHQIAELKIVSLNPYICLHISSNVWWSLLNTNPTR
jgi:hypothetical protein